MQPREHWQKVYSEKSTDLVSWFQPRAERSLALIRGSELETAAAIIDVGGGASTLVDDLLAAGFSDVTGLALSEGALAESRRRLGEAAARAQWLMADITEAQLPERAFDFWHDRAVFHFLVTPEARANYVASARRALKPEGHLIIATFAEDGPTRCSGLPVVRYSAEQLQAEFGADFTLRGVEREQHHTPSGAVQSFLYCHLQKRTA